MQGASEVGSWGGFARLGAPSFWRAYLPALVVTLLVFSRSPASNHIFDEQEALLANPFVAGHASWLDAFRLDFWGLPPHRTIGSYRPLPNLVWRALWWPVLAPISPWVLQLANVAGHAAVSAGLASFAWRVSGARLVGWCTGAAFLLSAVLTEAVSGVVGLADILGGAGVVLALHALRLPLAVMPVAVFASLCFGFGGKESVLAALPLVPLAALVTAPALHGERPLAWVRGMLALTGAVGALVAYTAFRKAYFPAPLPPELTDASPDGWAARLLHQFMVWFHQPKLPRDPMNNPLFEATTSGRVGAALRVYLSGLVQLVFPWSLSGDYSFPQERAAERLLSPAVLLGGVLLVTPVLCGGWLLLRSWRLSMGSWARPVALRVLVALGLVWLPIAYLPHSNLLLLLPTVRAERFWYLPALGGAFVFGVAAARLLAQRRAWAWAVVTFFFAFQGLQARAHALHYSDDLVFWRATRVTSPRSAKAHLNYAVMIGARGDLQGRLTAGSEALKLAPNWAMAHVYQGDVLCRLGRSEEAWEHYRKGFVLDPNAQNQIALAMQCLWDRGAIAARRTELLDLGARHRGTWLGYLASDIVHNGQLHRGVDPRYRPRGYNQTAPTPQPSAEPTP